jgi:hypothetical protein
MTLAAMMGLDLMRHGFALRERLPTWGDAGKLTATLPTELLGRASSGAVVDEPITLALGDRPAALYSLSEVGIPG